MSPLWTKLLDPATKTIRNSEPYSRRPYVPARPSNPLTLHHAPRVIPWFSTGYTLFQKSNYSSTRRGNILPGPRPPSGWWVRYAASSDPFGAWAPQINGNFNQSLLHPPAQIPKPPLAGKRTGFLWTISKIYRRSQKRRLRTHGFFADEGDNSAEEIRAMYTQAGGAGWSRSLSPTTRFIAFRALWAVLSLCVAYLLARHLKAWNITNNNLKTLKNDNSNVWTFSMILLWSNSKYIRT